MDTSTIDVCYSFRWCSSSHISENQSIYMFAVLFQWAIVKLFHCLKSFQVRSICSLFSCCSQIKVYNMGQEISHKFSCLSLSKHWISSSYHQEISLEAFALLFGYALLPPLIGCIVVGLMYTAASLLEEENGSLG